MKYKGDVGLDERSIAQSDSARRRQCPNCQRKSALSIVSSGKGYWIKKCRWCGHLKYWSSAKTFPDGLPNSMLERHRDKNEVSEVQH